MAYEGLKVDPQPGGEVEEKVVTSFRTASLIRTQHQYAPSDALTTANGINDNLHNLIVSRTLLAAARAGRLRRLHFERHPLPDVFAIRSLVPLWIAIEEWGLYSNYRCPEDLWQEAASALRPLLAHVSLWLAAPDTSASAASRLLTCADMQSLSAHFSDAQCSYTGVPAGLKELLLDCNGRSSYWGDENAVRRYLHWFKDDAKLAEQVADAWNAVVKRGEADRVRCYCEKCNTRWEYRVVKTVRSDGSIYARNEWMLVAGS